MNAAPAAAWFPSRSSSTPVEDFGVKPFFSFSFFLSFIQQQVPGKWASDRVLLKSLLVDGKGCSPDEAAAAVSETVIH